MSALLVALALATADPAAAGPTTPPVQAADPPFPSGAPHDDYGLVAWCYGALRGYLELHDQAMPEVKRIESTWRRPGSNLADDLAVYANLQREGQRQIKVFARAMEAAEKASIRPINSRGAAALQKGRSTWAAAANMPRSRLAQEWMSWALPARCEPTAIALEKSAKLMGATFQANDPDPLSGATEAPIPPATTTP